MSFGFVSGLALSRDTKQAWKDAGGVSLRMRDNLYEWQRAISDYDFLLNLGHRDLPDGEYPVPVINPSENIGALIYPESIRNRLPDLAVPRPSVFDGPQLVWIKPPGQRGRGKTKLHTERPLVLPEDWDWQMHIDGTEYRVVTVGRRAVQAFHRSGYNDNREYGWTGLANTPDEVLNAARTAAKHFHDQGSYAKPDNTMYAWDLIQTAEGQVYLFEGNTCPGTSEPTANRVVREIRRQIEEGRII